MVESIVFAVITIVAFGIAIGRFKRLFKAIQLGRPTNLEGPSSARWRNVFLVALGQRKMFKQVGPALFHFFIYAAFLLTQVELIEILVDGFTGRHRVFAAPLGGFYTFVISSIEVLSVLALVATIIFLIRRNVMRISRFEKPEMAGWPKRDANLILIGELLLITGFLSMNGADVLLQELAPAQYPDTGTLAVSAWLGPALFGGLSEGTLVIIERAGWWGHVLVVYFFLNYLPYSKHLHIFLAFPNAYYSRLNPSGEMANMPEVMNEVKSLMGLIEETEMGMEDELPEFGSNDVHNLPRTTLLGAYSCTECGRCTDACPANQTGKKLSPRKVMMDIRDRAEEVMDAVAEGTIASAEEAGETGTPLMARITPEELHACTTCQACIDACPVLINPLEPILELRRYEVLTAGEGPSEWIPMFNNIENQGAVWPVTDTRDAWTREA